MYCSTCGVSVVPDLSYCKNCGAKVNRDEKPSPPSPRPETLMASIVALFIFGLVGITMLMGMLKVVVRLPIESVLAISLLPLLLWLIIEGIFIRLLLRRTKEQTELAVPKQQVTNELDATRVRALPEPIPSVTEHTTRAFDPVFNDRK